MGQVAEKICGKDQDLKERQSFSDSLANSRIFKKSDVKPANDPIETIYQSPAQNIFPTSQIVTNSIVEEHKEDSRHQHLTYEDFEWKTYIGKGTFGKVALVVKKDSKKEYAIKILKKKDFSKKDIENAMTEQKILMNSHHPFIVKLLYSFQDATNLYYCIEYIPGGELFAILKKFKKFTADQTRFYAAEVLLALEYLHNEIKTIYRDLKPENILVNSDGHIKLTDFGLSKMGELKGNSFCGTPFYLAPEIIVGRGHDQAVDFWTFGCLIYEMLAGYPPFRNKNQNVLFGLIKKVILNLVRVIIRFLRILTLMQPVLLSSCW